MAKYEFLRWAVELANSELGDKDQNEFYYQHQLEVLAKKAVDNKIKISNFVVIEKGSVVEEESVFEELEIESKGEALKRNVLAFATAVTGQDPFIIIIEKKPSLKQYYVWNNICRLRSYDNYKGSVEYTRYETSETLEKDRADADKFYRNHANRFKSPKENDEEYVANEMKEWEKRRLRIPGIEEELPFNSLVDRFYQEIHKYCLDKKCGFNDLPLRICKLKSCKKPFFGRLRKQEFCCKRHGEIWHGKQAYQRRLKKNKAERR